MALTVDSLAHSSAEYLLAPMVALRVAEQQQKVLLVVDDALLFKFKETQVMDLADQPFSSFNLANELATRTGIFADGREVTTIVVVDKDTQTLQL